ncbi:spore germination protein KC [Alkalithermobacter thermoalcaliphilus JW-YL-7 = DSM 7308]|uniref:Germination protein, Ger(X)C family n=1 Tax=Alkalithermobacter thermoalcaliphilus JW-YL-7 = DSM 7308 TaxID=1121328 RepID=A0A150FUF2_CLOPD|nr:germination protein, Ger(x)C family [[Clostridium] paradoxum JW-YL-7 = DSM 7308]SHL18253.1 spore germination protein KC [[Clostridium] paradoxum JW-YL-7 = DSM 7308]
MIKKILTVITIISMSIGLTGCWNNHPLKEKAIVVAVGLDKAEDELIEATIQLARPNLLQPDQPTVQNAVKVVSSKGETIFEAVRNALLSINEKPYYGHNQIIIISEKIAKDGIQQYLDFFARDHEPGLKSYVLISKGISAKDVLHAKSMFESIPALYIKDIIENYKYVGKIKAMNLGEIIKELNYPENSPSIGVIQPQVEEAKFIEHMKIGGAAVFKEDKLYGYLNEIETRSLLFVKDDIGSGIIQMKNPLQERHKVALEIIRAKTNKDVELKGDSYKFIIDIKMDVNLAEQHGRGDLTSEQAIKMLEIEAQRVIKDQIREMLSKIQKEYQSDVVGFYKTLRRKYPDIAKEYIDYWEEEFSHVETDINVKVNVRRTGLIGQTIRSM